MVFMLSANVTVSFFLYLSFLLPLSLQAGDEIAGATDVAAGHLDTVTALTRRVPAEWEPQEAIWIQWPGPWEKSYERAFATFSCIILQYQKLHLLYQSENVRVNAATALKKQGCTPSHQSLTWHHVPYDSSWMRDNGPIFLEEGSEIRAQDWGFNAWGGRFGSDIPYYLDDKVPEHVAGYLDMPLETVPIVHERGNLEFNGAGALIVNWSALGDSARNGRYTKQQAESDLKYWFGVSTVIFIEGVPEGDRTNGHIDGIARFISPDTVAVAQCTKSSLCRVSDSTGLIFELAAEKIHEAGFAVVRDPIEGFVTFDDAKFDANYMNWLVGNGFVVTTGYDDGYLDDRAKVRLQSYFPGRDIHVLPMLDSWAAGGGIHCHTSDQPKLSSVAK